MGDRGNVFLKQGLFDGAIESEIGNARAGTKLGGTIAWVAQRTVGNRKAAATYATGELVSKAGEERDAFVKITLPIAGELAPIRGAYRLAARFGVQTRLDICQGDADALCNANDRYEPQD